MKSPSLNYIIHGKNKEDEEFVRGGKRKYKKQKPEVIMIRKGTPEDFVSHIHAAYDIHKRDFLPRVEKALTTI